MDQGLRESLLDSENGDTSERLDKILNENATSTSASETGSSREPGTYKKAPWDCLFVNKNDNEEETWLYRVEALEPSYLKRYLLTPLLTIMSVGMTIPIMYWYPSIKAFLLYNRSTDLRNRATHMLITGYKDHKEIVEVYFRESERNPNTKTLPYEEEKRVPRKF